MNHRTPITIAGLATAAVLLSGCTSATGAASSDPEPMALSSSQQECVAAVQADVDAARAEKELIAPDSSLDLDALSGKSIWFISVAMNQWATTVAEGAKAAAEAADVKLTIFDGQGAANRFNEGISQAVAQDADGIILLGIDPAVVAAPLAEAKAAGIPVQNNMNGDPDDAVPAGMYGNLTSDFSGDGAIAAKWALVDSGCQAQMTILASSTVPVWEAQADAAVAEFEEYCPEDCAVSVLDIDIANVATDVGRKVQTELQRNAETDYVYAAWDSAVPFIAPVLSAANSSAQVLGRDGVQASLDMIVNDSGQDMTLAMPSGAWIGWASVDDIMRVMTGAPAAGYVVPSRVIDADNVGAGTPSDVFPEFVDFEQAFTAAWKG